VSIRIFVLAALLCSPFASACDKPVAPELPDPNAAVTAQMVKAKNDMKDYIAAAESYLKCVEADTRSYNAMVETMQKAADEFNTIVRKYKARMGAS
jgi:hypothetical protein